MVDPIRIRVGDVVAVHHARVQRPRVAQDDVLSAIRREQVAGPVGIRVLIQWHLGQPASFEFLGEFLGKAEDHRIIAGGLFGVVWDAAAFAGFSEGGSPLNALSGTLGSLRMRSLVK